MIDLDRSVFRRSADLLRPSLAGLQNDARIFEALTKNSGLSAAEATSDLPLNETNPLLFITQLGSGLNGLFKSTSPTIIAVDVDMFHAVENNPGDAAIQKFLLAKVLHEFVHWARFKKQLPPGSEMGEQFERDAFGGIVELPGMLGAAAAAGSAALAANADAPDIRPRGIRNNNPGNIKQNGVPWEGLSAPNELIGLQKHETIFCVFKEPKWGIRAIARIFKNYQVRSGLSDVRSMISRWAPASDKNEPGGYSDFVSAKMGIRPDASFSFAGALAASMVTAVIAFENGVQPYSVPQITEATNLGLQI